MNIALLVFLGLSVLVDLALGAWASAAWGSFTSVWKLHFEDLGMPAAGDAHLLGLVLGLALLCFAAVQILAMVWTRAQKEEGPRLAILFGIYLIVSSIVTAVLFRNRLEFLLVDGIRGAALCVLAVLALNEPSTVRSLRLPGAHEQSRIRGREPEPERSRRDRRAGYERGDRDRSLGHRRRDQSTAGRSRPDRYVRGSASNVERPVGRDADRETIVRRGDLQGPRAEVEPRREEESRRSLRSDAAQEDIRARTRRLESRPGAPGAGGGGAATGPEAVSPKRSSDDFEGPRPLTVVVRSGAENLRNRPADPDAAVRDDSVRDQAAFDEAAPERSRRRRRRRPRGEGRNPAQSVVSRDSISEEPETRAEDTEVAMEEPSRTPASDQDRPERRPYQRGDHERTAARLYAQSERDPGERGYPGGDRDRRSRRNRDRNRRGAPHAGPRPVEEESSPERPPEGPPPVETSSMVEALDMLSMLEPPSRSSDSGDAFGRTRKRIRNAPPRPPRADDPGADDYRTPEGHPPKEPSPEPFPPAPAHPAERVEGVRETRNEEEGGSAGSADSN